MLVTPTMNGTHTDESKRGRKKRKRNQFPARNNAKSLKQTREEEEEEVGKC